MAGHHATPNPKTSFTPNFSSQTHSAPAAPSWICSENKVEQAPSPWFSWSASAVLYNTRFGGVERNYTPLPLVSEKKRFVHFVFVATPLPRRKLPSPVPHPASTWPVVRSACPTPVRLRLLTLPQDPPPNTLHVPTPPRALPPDAAASNASRRKMEHVGAPSTARSSIPSLDTTLA